jgi:ABC-type nitrate/sulfonate/bicarbonate transport system substrate-binding protein
MRKSGTDLFATAAKAAVLAGALALAAVSTAALAQTKIKVGRTTGASGFHLPSYVAVEKGFFKKEGLDASFVAMTAKALVTAGMGGAVDFVPIPGGGSQANLMGAKLVYVVGESLISQWAVVTPKNINTVADLKGKTCGYGRPGSADYDEGEIVLSRFFKMNVGRDYKVISFQGEPERIAALINGDIQCGLVSFPHAAKGMVAGMKILLKTGEYLPRIGGTFWVTEKYLNTNRKTVKSFIRAIATATQYIQDDKDGTIEVIQKYYGVKNKSEAGFIWDTLHTAYGPDIPAELFRKVFEGRKKRMESQGGWPKGKPLPDTEKFVARDLLTETLVEMGYYMQRPPKVQGKLN